MKTTNTGTKKYFFIAALFIIILASGLVFGGNYLLKIQTENQQKRYLANQYSKEVDKINVLIQDYNDASTRTGQVEEAIPNREQVVDFVDQLESIGELLGVETTVSFFDGVVDEEGIVVSAVSEGTEGIVKYTGIIGVEVLEVGVDIKGGLPQVINFVGTIQELKYYLNVSSSHINLVELQEDEETDPFVEGVLTIMLFVEKGVIEL